MKKQKVISAVLRIIAAAVLTVICSTSFCACQPDVTSDEIGNMTVDLGENGAIRNGTEYYTYRVETGYKGVVSVTISKKSGRFDLDIYPTDRKDDKEYSGRELDSTSFSVILSEPGEYKVRVTAKDFVGGYEIDWKTEKTKKE